MAKKYWVKKDPKNSAEWVEMTGKEFYEFINSTEGKGRHFIDFDACKLEVTQEQYRQWQREADHRRYLQQFEDMADILSLDYLTIDSGISGDYCLVDDSESTEDKIIRIADMEALAEALRSLSDEERWMIGELYLYNKTKTEDELALLIGKTRQVVNKQKKKILKKLEKLVAKS